MNMTVQVLKSEAKRLRTLADRLEAFALELDGERGVELAEGTIAAPARPRNGEYSGLTQIVAVLKALRDHGPQDTAELFERLNAGGQHFKKRTYVTALLSRVKDKVERIAGGKVRLKAEASQP
jgi:hypothetical protein